MKKLILSILTVLLIVNVFAQSGDHRRPASFGVSFFVNDFKSAAEIKKNGLGDYLKAGNLFNKDRFGPGMAINFLKGLSDHVDFSGTLGASFVNYPIPNKPSSGNQKILLETTASLNLKLVNDNHWVVPFADLGVGISRYTSYYAAFAPLGAGVQVNISEDVFFNLNMQYRLPITENAAAHLYHSITFYSVLGKKKK